MDHLGHKLGCESALVQAKLGHDMRRYLEDTVRSDLPARLQALVDEMMGYTDFRPLDVDHGAGVVSGSVKDWRTVRHAGSAAAFLNDRPFDFRTS